MPRTCSPNIGTRNVVPVIDRIDAPTVRLPLVRGSGRRELPRDPWRIAQGSSHRWCGHRVQGGTLGTAYRRRLTMNSTSTSAEGQTGLLHRCINQLASIPSIAVRCEALKRCFGSDCHTGIPHTASRRFWLPVRADLLTGRARPQRCRFAAKKRSRLGAQGDAMATLSGQLHQPGDRGRVGRNRVGQSNRMRSREHVSRRH